MHEIPEGLAAMGHEILFVDFPEGEAWLSGQPTVLDSKVSGRVVQDQEFTLLRQGKSMGNLFGRLITALTFGIWFRRVLAKRRPDVVVTYAVPTSGWQAVHECSRAGIPIVYRALDVSHLIRKSVFRTIVRRKEHQVIRSADWVSANNPELARYCSQIRGSDQTVSFDRPPLDLDHFSAVEVNVFELRRRLGVPTDATVYLYMGSFFYFSGLEEVIESFSRERLANDFLVLIGGGEREEALRDLVKKLQVSDRVIFTGVIHYDLLPQYLRIADVALNPMQASLVSHTAIPNKIFQYLSCNIPVVSTRLRGLSSSGLDSELLFCVPSSSEVFQEAQRIAREHKAMPGEFPNNALSLAPYKREIALANFEKLLSRVVGSVN